MKKLIKTDCIHFDPCQGRNKCCNDKVKSNRCILDCGEFQGEKPETKFIQSRDLTDEEWMELPKEEILQLYKNCYKMLTDLIKKPEVWSKIESDFIEWDNETHSNSSQRDILDWFKERFETKGIITSKDLQDFDEITEVKNKSDYYFKKDRNK